MGIDDGNQVHLSVLSEADIETVHAGSVEVLERTGLFVESDQAREAFSGAGALVEGERVRIPPASVEAALSSVPHQVTVYDRDGEPSLFCEGNRTYYVALSDCVLIIDPYSGQTRPFTSADYRLTVNVIAASSHLHCSGAGGNAVDYPAEVRQQVSVKESLVRMKKPLMAHALTVQQMLDIDEMAVAVAGSEERARRLPFIIATAEPVSPLAIFKDASEIVAFAASKAMPLVWYPMPAAGISAPATPAATLTLGNVEVLAGLVLHQAQSPGSPFIYGSMPSMTDMRSIEWAYGSPDLALMVAATADLSHHYGIPFFGTAGCSDATAVDQQAAAEAAMLFTMARLSGANLIHDIGILGCNNAISPEMLVLCDELIEMSVHATRAIVPSVDELMLDLIDRVGPRGNYMAERHTRDNFRRFWHSPLFLRKRLKAVQQRPDSFSERLNERTRQIIETYEDQLLPADTVRELDELEAKWIARVGATPSPVRADVFPA
jgi:trimethylamine--corrinoid protein Co-methyltransferase